MSRDTSRTFTTRGSVTDSSIARIAGNIIGEDVEDWLVGGTRRRGAVQAAVATARDIAAEVTRTRPVQAHEVADFVRDMQSSVLDGHAMQTQNPFNYIAARIDEHFQPAERELPEKAPACLYASPQCEGRVLPGTGLCEAHSGVVDTPAIAAHVLELPPAEAYKLGWNDAKADRDELRPEYDLSTLNEVTPERKARGLLDRLGAVAPEQGQWSSGDLVELANLFAENRHLNQTIAIERDEVVRLQRARIGDSETIGRLMSEVEGLKSEVQRLTAVRAYKDAPEDRRLDGPVPDGALTIPVEVCLGCNRQTNVHACGCPAGTGTRLVPAISEAEYRQKARAVRAALLGDGVKDPGHPPTAEMARSLRTSHDKLLEEVRLLREQLGPRVEELKAHLADALHQIEALKGLRPHEQRIAATAAASALRRSADEIENSLRTPSVPDRELLLNCVAWYRAQADNLDPDAAALRKEMAMWHGGGPGGGKDARLRASEQRVSRLVSRVCPTCTSPDRARHPAVQHEGEVQPCGDPWHGVPRNAQAPEVQAAQSWTGGPERWKCKKCGRERRRSECLHCGSTEPLTDKPRVPGVAR
jgi:hypothetical protein